jgi:transposase
VPAKADPQEQARFLGDELRPRLDQARRGRRAVLFVDAAHFVYGPFLGFLWCLVRRLVPGPSGRKRYNVLAALDAVTHRVIRVANGSYINAPSVCDLLRAVAGAALPGVPVTPVLDNARYQKCALVQDLARGLGIELLYLPGYSPNLNLIERLWKFLRKQALQRWHNTFEEMQAAVADVLDNLSRYKEELDTLMSEKFHILKDEEVPLAQAA